MRLCTLQCEFPLLKTHQLSILIYLRHIKCQVAQHFWSVYTLYNINMWFGIFNRLSLVCLLLSTLKLLVVDNNFLLNKIKENWPFLPKRYKKYYFDILRNKQRYFCYFMYIIIVYDRFKLNHYHLNTQCYHQSSSLKAI